MTDRPGYEYSWTKNREGDALLRCPSCQTAVSDDSHFCSKCGASLKGEAQTRTIQSPGLILKKGQIIAGKYRIIQKIGEGGMGVVYKAQDTKLDRPVALKFLPSEMTRDPASKERFIQEAKAAAALNHPNITVVHEIGEDEGLTFIAMEFIEGETLRDKIESGPLGIEETVNIASQVAEGLKEAHDKGITHRDIKPANIMLTKKGPAKIMDFGLAKLSWGADLTKPSMIMGTVAYMSPEQARGESVDHRTDIWSLGAMLYEMLTGEKPFQKGHDQALIHSILNDEPKRIFDVRSDVPGYLEKAITRALEKNANRRFQTAEEMLQELKQSPSVIFREAKKSIVVLPFENLSPDPEQEYFSDGLTEEIISDLSQVQDLLVISRSSAMTYKGTKKKIIDIGRELNVHYALEGSVRKSGDKLRITAQLIDALNDVHLWSGKYNGNLDDVFDIQEKVSRSIIEALSMKLSSQEDRRLSERPIKNLQAFECYLRARNDIQTFTKEGLDQALRYLYNGLDIVGANALLYAGVGYAYAQYVNIGLEQEEYISKAEEYAKKALAIDSESAKAHFVLGFLTLFLSGNPREYITHFKRALSIQPDDPDALMWLLAGYAINWGKPKEARRTYERLVRVDPFHPWAYLIYVLDVMVDGKLDQPIDYLTKWYRMEPQNPAAIFFCVQFLAYCNYFKEALEIVDEHVQPDGRNAFLTLSLFLKCTFEGNKVEIKKLLTFEFKKSAKRDPQNSYFISGYYALLGMKEEAFEWLENAVDRGFINYPFISKYDPFLKNIRSEPRFKKLMERVKYEWDKFEV